MKEGYERHQHEDNFGLSKQKDFKDAAVSYNYNHVIYKGNRSSHQNWYFNQHQVIKLL